MRSQMVIRQGLKEFRADGNELTLRSWVTNLVNEARDGVTQLLRLALRYGRRPHGEDRRRKLLQCPSLPPLAQSETDSKADQNCPREPIAYPLKHGIQ